MAKQQEFIIGRFPDTIIGNRWLSSVVEDRIVNCIHLDLAKKFPTKKEADDYIKTHGLEKEYTTYNTVWL